MNLDLDAEAVVFRDVVRGFLGQNVLSTPLPAVDTPAGDAAHRAWERKLADAGLAAVSWPVEYGGRAAPPLHALLFDEEYHAAGAPVRIGQNGLFLLAPTLLAHGTPAQCARVLPPMARGDEVWAQAWSEPAAGSDLASIRSRAVRGDGGWVLSGQKTWSSRAVVADRAFGLFRSHPGEPRHHGLTYLMFDLRAPGVTVRPIRQLDGTAGFAEIFLDDVFVPDADVIGTPGDGWRVAMSTAGHERGLSLRGPGRFTAAAGRLVALSLAPARTQRCNAAAETALHSGPPTAARTQRCYETAETALESGPPTAARTQRCNAAAETALDSGPSAARTQRCNETAETASESGPPVAARTQRCNETAETAPESGRPTARSQGCNELADTALGSGRLAAARNQGCDAAADTALGSGRLAAARSQGCDAAAYTALGSGRVVDAWIGARAYRMQAYASLEEPVPPSAMKLFWSELDASLHETALDVLGPYAEITPEWTDGYLFSLAGPIYAGTNEIQRDILAQRELGLPR